ncbi:Uncharacterized protein dnm_031280 [Desulfonema magnum]|uniref:Uncharacterized protein n=1 Tax=Desulfonema magnum TaxID=45655 RepID=A0A975BL39_9BACT|nr:Uncharacterized protein dnm_031280 [Desulfonema magnum]
MNSGGVPNLQFGKKPRFGGRELPNCKFGTPETGRVSFLITG